MKRQLIFILVTLLLFNSQIFAQQGVITGIVRADDGSPLPGAAVQIKGTSIGVTTGLDGKYTIDISGYEDPVLTFTFVGYLTEEVTVGNQTNIDITLVSDIQSLEEVVVVGYGVAKKSLVTGAIAKVDGDEIAKSRSTRVESALQGKTAGVLVQQTSGAPGAEQVIIVRGVGSDNSVRPIYVIDGIRTDGIDWLDPEDIESVEVLKDAASAAIYGVEGANGVILITTKMGKKGQTNVSYDGYYGMQNVLPGFNVLDTKGYLDYYRTAYLADNPSADMNEAILRYPDSDINTNWLDEIFEPAPTQKHKLSVNGASEKSNYYFSISYTDQDGIIGGGDKSNFTRYATKFNLDSKATNWLSLGTRMSYSYSRKKGIYQNSVFGSITNNAVVLDPTTPVYYNSIDEFSDLDRTNMENGWGEDWYTNPGIQDENGYFGISQLVLNETRNPVMQLANDKDQDWINKIIGGVYTDIQFFEGLNFKTTFDIDLSHNYNRGWTPRTYGNSMQTPTVRSEARQEINMYFTWQWESYLTFNKSFGDHTLGAVLGSSAREYTHEVLGGVGKELNKESDNYAWIDEGLYIDTLANTSWGRLGGWERLASVFGRLSYTYKEKYMFTSNFRRDGGSKFGPANRIDIFPSISFGWIATREDFWNVPFITFLKPRYSWGKNGNAAGVDWNWRYLPLSSSGQYYYVSGTDQLLPVVEPSRLSNPEYHWETSIQNDLGVDMRMFNNKLNFTLDLYKKISSGFLFEGQVPILAGNNPPTVNAGDIENKGIEIELGYSNYSGELKYSIQLTASHNKSKVTKMNDAVDYLTGGNIGTFGSSKRFEVGYEPWYFYGYKTDGIFTSDEEIQDHKNADDELLQPNAQVGDVKYLDIAGAPNDSVDITPPDGVIDENDRTDLGSPYPKLITGLNINLEYKGFDLNLATYAQIGNKTLMAVSVRDDLSNTNKPDFYLYEAYDPETGSGDFPRVTVRDRNRNFSRVNEFLLQDGSFLRLSNITLGYTVSETITSKIHIKSLRVYVAVDNLYTFTKYKGMEPEIGGDYWGYRGQQWAGIDQAVYPKPRSFLAGVNVKF